MSKQSIPTLDLLEYRTQPEAFAAQLGAALHDLGFFILVNHGIDQALIEGAYQAAEQFFLLSEPEKRAYEELQLKGQRGFTRFGREHAKDHPTPDLKEFWHVGRELPADHPLAAVYPANVWPREVPEFKPLLIELYQQLDACAATLLQAVALYLGEPRDRISDLARDGNTILRVIHYPPVPDEAPASAVRAAAHEDINLITLLCEATAGGLELLTREGHWLPIQAGPGQIVVDSGDMIQNLTNGLLRSTTHRVTNPDIGRERRFSMPFFVHPRAEVDLTPLPGCVERTGGTPAYPSIRAGEYLLQRLREIGLA